jgi:hypothetical protein
VFLRAGQSAKARKNTITIFAIGTSIKKLKAGEKPAFLKILQYGQTKKIIRKIMPSTRMRMSSLTPRFPIVPPVG